MAGAKLRIESNVKLDLPRCGVVAFGKYDSGHPSHPRSCLISLRSFELVKSVGEWLANVSCSQIDTHAINTHKKENGSRAAMSLLVLKTDTSLRVTRWRLFAV